MLIKLETKFNLTELKALITKAEQLGPPWIKNDRFWGGWSVTSSNGDIYDGWQSGEKIFNENLPDEVRVKQLIQFRNLKFDTPTPLYDGSLEEVLKKIHSYDLKTTRMRIAVLLPHSEEEAYWHQDARSVDQHFRLRLHIPLITNEKCTFEYKNRKWHLPADGSSYLLDVSKPHRVLNLSNEKRYHLMMDVF
jgi:hypothetical protein